MAVFLTFKRAQSLDRDSKLALDIGLIILVTGFLGGRLFHVFYENFEFYQKNPSHIFKVWQGGFVFYGGFITAFLAAAFFLKKRKESIRGWADFFAPIVSITYAIGRLGCFFAGCCYGRYCDLPWAIDFQRANERAFEMGLPDGPRHPTALYATLIELFVLSVILFGEKRSLFQKPGQLFCFWLMLHSIGRLIMEFCRDDFRGPELFGLSVSSAISVGLFLGSLFFIVQFYRNKIKI